MSIGEVQLSHQNITVNTIQVLGAGPNNTRTLLYVIGKTSINDRTAICLKEYNSKNISSRDDFNKTLKEGRLVVVMNGGTSVLIHQAWYANSKDSVHDFVVIGDKLPKIFIKENSALQLNRQDYDKMQQRYAGCDVLFPKAAKNEHKSKS